MNHPYLNKQKERNAYKNYCGNKYTKIYLNNSPSIEKGKTSWEKTFKI